MREQLAELKAMGVKRLVALRGDLPSGYGMGGEFHYASDLVAFIRDETGRDFHIEVACYPEVHPQARSPEADLQAFAAKVQAGRRLGDHAVLLQPRGLLPLRRRGAQARASTMPIVPGIMPITSSTQLMRFSDACGAEIPRWIRLRLQGFGDDTASIKAFGLDVVTELCERLRARRRAGDSLLHDEPVGGDARRAAAAGLGRMSRRRLARCGAGRRGRLAGGLHDAARVAERGLQAAGLRPLAHQLAVPPGAPPRSQVPSVRYDLAVSGAGELTPDDGVPGDEGPREIFERGGASWYGIQFHQRKTANGERFDMTAMTAAHKTLPFNTRVCVRSLVNGREVLVRINDRGPYASGRIIDLSRAAAESIGMLGMGIKQVALSIVDKNGVALRRCGGRGGCVRCAGRRLPRAPARPPAARKTREVPPRLRR